VRRLLRFSAYAAAVLVVLALGLVALVEARWQRTYDAPYPAVQASHDAAVIARGEYIVRGLSPCAECHTPQEDIPRVASGQPVALRGGHLWALPIGRLYSPNLTPDPETGIGGVSDAALARVLRYGVRPDGRVALPFMEFHDASDEDLEAIVSYLRAQPPVRHPVPDHQPNLLGKAVLAFKMTPVGPTSTPRRTSPPVAPTVERGKYLAAGLAGCVGCHTARSDRDGSFLGPAFAGGSTMHAVDGSDRTFVTPNLTPDERTGHISRWTEEAFVTRFRLGSLAPGSPMPWVTYRNMKEEDVRAVYRYLRSLAPVDRDNGPVVRTGN
jgi:mono/diheme cytochrome c family protein